MNTFQYQQIDHAQRHFNQAMMTIINIRVESNLGRSDIEPLILKVIESRSMQSHDIERHADGTKLNQYHFSNDDANKLHLAWTSSTDSNCINIAVSSKLIDGLGINQLLKDLNTSYKDQALKETLLYTQYAEWQQDGLADAGNYWDEWSQQANFHNPLPYAKPNYESVNRIAYVDKAIDLSDAVSEMSEHYITAAWLQVLSRLTQESLSIGLVQSGRVSDELSIAYGAYSVLVPVNMCVEDDSPRNHIITQLEALEEDLLDAQVSFPKQSATNQRWPNHSICFIEPIYITEEQVFQVEDIWHTTGTFETQLCCIKSNGTLKLRLYFDQNVIAMKQAEHFMSLVCNSLLSPSASVTANKLNLYKDNYQDIAVQIDSANGFSVDLNIVDVLRTQAVNQPDCTALIDSEGVLTYSKLLEAVENTCAGIINRYPPGSLIGVCMQHSNDVLVSMLGISAAACTFVPIDPDLPTGRLKQLIDKCSICIVDEHVKARMQGSAVDFNALIKLKDLSSLESVPVGRTVNGSDVAYLLFTSGSTGEPKGVEITHENMMSYLMSVEEAYLANANKSIVHSSIGFDLTITSLFLPLLRAGSIEFIKPDGTLEPLQACLEQQEQAVMLKLTPSHLKAMKPWIEGATRDSLKLSTLVVGGEQLYSFELRSWFEKLPSLVAYNEYGPTEATVGCIVHEVKRSDHGAVPIGKPLENTSYVIADRLGVPVDDGVIGELFLTGVGIAKGYYSSPLQTDEYFSAPSSHSNSDSDSDYSWYRTGDLVYKDSVDTDCIHFVGRADRQVKIRGYRLELSEIETCIRNHESTRDAYVTLESANGNVGLAAYCVSSEIEALEEYLKQHLPTYAVPDRIFSIEKFPLTSNGKLDVAGLQKLAIKQRKVEPIVATTDAEKEMAHIWAEVLESEPPGINENFFELGGDSIRAVYVVANAKELGYVMSVHDLFKNPTIEQLLPNLEKESDQLTQLKSKNIDDLINSVDDLDESEIEALLSELD